MPSHSPLAAVPRSYAHIISALLLLRRLILLPLPVIDGESVERRVNQPVFICYQRSRLVGQFMPNQPNWAIWLVAVEELA